MDERLEEIRKRLNIIGHPPLNPDDEIGRLLIHDVPWLLKTIAELRFENNRMRWGGVYIPGITP